jgi:hypothetical protein
MAASSQRTYSLLAILGIGFVALIVLALVLLFCIFAFGVVVGEEFSPDTFESRSYYYWQIPLLQVQVTSVVQETSTGAFASRLIADKLIKKRKHSRWDLVRQYAGGGMYSGDSALLARHLDSSMFSNSDWSTWTDDHAKLAAVFWPRVASLARADLYVLLPGIFETALANTSADKPATATAFTAELDKAISAAAIPLGEIALSSGDAKRSVEILSVVLKWQPKNAAALKLRAKAYRELGEEEKATKDEGMLKEERQSL